MTWFRADDALWRSRKIRKLGRERVSAPALVACAGIWILAGTWSADNLTDGFVPWDILEDWDDTKHRLSERLIGVGLWDDAEHDNETGIRFHDWPDYNPLRVAVLAEREAAAERMRKIRESRKGKPRSQERSGEHLPNEQPHDDGTFDVGSASPTRPDPVSTSNGHQTGRSLVRSAHDGRPADRCGKHANDLDPPACGPCGAARRAAEAWDADEPRRVRNQRLTIRDCGLCDADGWRLIPGRRLPVTPYVACDHTRNEVHA